MTTAEWSWITCTASVLGCWLMGRSPQAEDWRSGRDWRVFALHEVPEGEAK